AGRRERAVIDRLPTGAVFVGREGHRLPVAGELPLLNELAVDPTVFALAPRLDLPVLDVRELAGLELHEDIVAVDERRLVVHEQVTRGVRAVLLLVHEWVVDDVGQDVRSGLSGHGDEALMLRVLSPVAPPNTRGSEGADCKKQKCRADGHAFPHRSPPPFLSAGPRWFIYGCAKAITAGPDSMRKKRVIQDGAAEL